MNITLHSLTPQPGSRVKKFRVGRGLGSGRGKTSGRGTKGQRSRTGGRKNLKLKGLKRMLLGFPKTRGFRSLEPKVAAVPLIRLEGLADGTEVTLKALQDLGLVPRRNLSAKIIGSGPLSKELTVKGVAVTAGAKAAIEKAGGRVI